MILAMVVVLTLGLLTFSPGQTTIAPMDRDEARFAQASKQMLADGDYITPRFQQELRAKKPVGIYWLQSASASLFGAESIASYRLPSLIGGLMVLAATVYFARFFFLWPYGLLLGALMSTNVVLVVESHLAKTDALLAALIAVQQITLWRMIDLHRDRSYVSGKYAVLFWTMMAMAILIKGPIAPVIAALTLLTLMAAERRLDFYKPLRPILGLVILTALVIPWVVMVTSATDGAFLSIAVKGDLVSKIQSGQESHGAPPLTYLALMMVTLWPASLFFARAIPLIIKGWRHPNILFCLAWVVPFWILLELTPTKLPHYPLPVYMGLVMLMGFGMMASLPPQGAGIRGNLARISIQIWENLFMVIGPLLGVIVLYAATDAGGNRGMATLALIFSLGVSAAAFWWQRGGETKAIAAMIAAAAGFHITVMGGVMPSLEDIRIAPRIHGAIAAMEVQPDLVVAAGYHEPSLVFVQGTDTLLFSPKDAALALAEADNGLALVESRAETDFINTATAIGLSVERFQQINGHNISRGQDVQIGFYRRKIDANN